MEGLGFSNPKFEIKQPPPNMEVDLSAEARSTRGCVSDVYVQARDASFMNFPCFRTTAQFKGGMSGGPIFNSEGEL